MFTILEPETQAPEVYRNTPFEHVLTADIGQLIVICTTPLAPQGWITTTGLIQLASRLPGWMPQANVPTSQPPLPGAALGKPAGVKPDPDSGLRTVANFLR